MLEWARNLGLLAARPASLCVFMRSAASSPGGRRRARQVWTRRVKVEVSRSWNTWPTLCTFAKVRTMALALSRAVIVQIVGIELVVVGDVGPLAASARQCQHYEIARVR
mgnify:CR=1 FL=1